MPLSYKNLFAKRLDAIKSSAIRDLLKQAGKKDFISLGGGYPALESFPVDLIRQLIDTVIGKYGPNIFQYGATEGFIPLLEILPKFLMRKNRMVKCLPENIALTSGSQMALDFLGKILINRGDKIAVESPTYLGFLQAFYVYGPNYVEIETDRDGMIPESLEEKLKKHPDIKLIYVVSTFQNPAGKTISLERRKKIAAIIKKYKKICIEDDPYSEIRFEEEPIPSIYSFAPKNVIYLFTFSKTLAPDFRVGGIVAPTEIIKKINLVKQGVVLYTSNFSQAIVSEYLAGDFLEKHIPKIVSLYRPKRDLMAQSIKKFFPEEFDFVLPKGGLFIWAFLKKNQEKYQKIDIIKVSKKSIESGVGFVPGPPFFANSTGKEVTMRLNFSNQSESNIEKGIKIIGDILNNQLP